MCEQNDIESPRDEAASTEEKRKTESDASESVTPEDTYPPRVVYSPSSHFC